MKFFEKAGFRFLEREREGTRQEWEGRECDEPTDRKSTVIGGGGEELRCMGNGPKLSLFSLPKINSKLYIYTTFHDFVT